MNYIYSVKMGLKRTICNRRFIYCVLAVSVLFIMDLLPFFISGIKECEGKTYFSYDIISLVMLQGATYFLGFSFIMTIIPGAGVYCDDKNNAFLIPIVERCGILSYAVGNTISVAVSAFLCTFLGLLLCFGFFGIFIPFVRMDMLDISYSLLAEKKTILFFVLYCILYSLRASFFSLVSFMLSTLIKNKYVIYSLPFIMYFFLMKFGYSILNLPGYLNVLGVYFSLNNEAEVGSVIYAFVFTVITAVLTVNVVSNRMRREL